MVKSTIILAQTMTTKTLFPNFLSFVIPTACYIFTSLYLQQARSLAEVHDHHLPQRSRICPHKPFSLVWCHYRQLNSGMTLASLAEKSLTNAYFGAPDQPSKAMVLPVWRSMQIVDIIVQLYIGSSITLCIHLLWHHSLAAQHPS